MTKVEALVIFIVDFEYILQINLLTTNALNEDGGIAFSLVNLVFVVNVEHVPNKKIAHLNKVLRDRASFSF